MAGNKRFRFKPPIRLIPKLCGYDGEVGNFISGREEPQGTGRAASHALLREFDGIPADNSQYLVNCSCSDCRWKRTVQQQSMLNYAIPVAVYGDTILTAPCGGGGNGGKESTNPQDVGRMYLPANGGCVYIDLDHLELCIPEVRSAYDHVACFHAMLRLTRDAMHAANQHLPAGEKIRVFLNNSDGLGHSYGTHLNFLITEKCRENIFERKMHYLLYLAAYQVSSIIFAGQGKVGSENGAPDVDFQLSQRADFFEQLVGFHTTHNRPLVNSRNEALCGTYAHRKEHPRTPEQEMSRIHVIFYDSTLCHVSSLLKVGVLQIILSMIEAECVNSQLILDDPISALMRWSHDRTLTSRAATWSGKRLTALELQFEFLDEAKRFVDKGHCEGIVPRAREIVALWEDTLLKLRQNDFPALTKRLDWVLKYSLLEGVMAKHRRLDWKHPSVKHLDHVYSSLDLEEGLFWAYEKKDYIERVVERSDIERFLTNPPEDTRAWARAMLLRTAGKHRVSGIDWDHIQFATLDDDLTYVHKTVDLANPLGYTREKYESVLKRSERAGHDGAATALNTIIESFAPSVNQ